MASADASHLPLISGTGMADDSTTSHRSSRPEGSNPRSRAPGHPDAAGGFRIRLSDNEMQAARALQEAFGLRSTVAVLGFSLRTLAQQLEEGKLDELVAQQRAQGGGGTRSDRGGGPREERFQGPRGAGRGAQRERVDPFARPSRPEAAPAVVIERAEEVETETPGIEPEMEQQVASSTETDPSIPEVMDPGEE